MNLMIYGSLHSYVHTCVCLWESLRKKRNSNEKKEKIEKDFMKKTRQIEKRREPNGVKRIYRVLLLDLGELLGERESK